MGFSGVLDRPVWSLSATEKLARLEEVLLLERQLAAVRLELVAGLIGDGQHGKEGYRSAGVWLRDRLRVTGNAGRRMADLAVALEAMPALAKALDKGVVSEPQAAVIAKAVADLPADTGPEARMKAEECLIDEGAVFEPEVVARLGKRILDHVAPEVAEERDRKALARADKRAWEERSLTISPDGTGRHRVSGWLTGEVAAKLSAVLDPLTHPVRHDESCGCGEVGVAQDHRTFGQRQHDALGEVCDLVLATGELPESGGEKAQVVVTTRFDVADRELSEGLLDTGVKLSPEAVRRWCCDAGIIPAVLGGLGQVLDLGRERRNVSAALRRALVLRDKGCAFPGCHKPPKWTHTHHIWHWARGGPTNLKNCVLLCSHHHHYVHEDEWSVRIAKDGLPEFIPPAWLDPEQRPRRNHHRRT